MQGHPQMDLTNKVNHSPKIMYRVSQPIPHPCPCFSAHNPLLWFPANYIRQHTKGEKRTNFSLSGNLPLWQFTVFLFWKFYDPNHLWQLLYRLKYYIEERLKPITQTNYSTAKLGIKTYSMKRERHLVNPPKTIARGLETWLKQLPLL